MTQDGFITDLEPPRAPREPVPPHSCDCAIHVFGDSRSYPARNMSGGYSALSGGTFEASRRMHDVVGIERAVIVQASLYAADHALLRDVLRTAPEGRYRGVAIVDDTVSDTEIARLHDCGVRAARFNFWAQLGLVPNFADFRRNLERIRPFGWHARIFADADGWIELAPEVQKLRTPWVIDHMGKYEFSAGMSHPAYRVFLNLLRRDNVWMMLSNGTRFSSQGRPWEDTVEIARSFYEAAPNRCIWGSDWPHVRARDMPANEGEQIELLYRYLPDDEARCKVLVDNPARLYGFEQDS